MLDFLNNKKDSGVTILFDIGGTKMRVVAEKEGKIICEPKVLPTPRDFKDGVAFLEKLADEARGDESIKAVVGGIPGMLRKGGETIFHLPNLPEWDGAPIKAALERTFGVPTFVENDSALAGLGEATYGAGKSHHIVAYLTVSTGVGGARIVGGKIDNKSYGFEPGKQIVDVSGRNLDYEGRLGEHISGRAVKERFGVEPVMMTDKVILDDFAYWLSVGLHNSILHWSPDIFVLGGPLILGQNPIPIVAVEAKLKELLQGYPEIPPLRKAALGDMAGLYGALGYAKQKNS